MSTCRGSMASMATSSPNMVDNQRHCSSVSVAKHHIDTQSKMSVKGEYLTVPADSTISPRLSPSNNSFDQREYSNFKNTTSFHHHSYDDLFKSKPVPSSFEPEWLARQGTMPKSANYPIISETRDPWLNNPSFTKSTTSCDENPYNRFPNRISPTNSHSPQVPTPAKNSTEIFNFDIPSYQGNTTARQPTLVSLYRHLDSINNVSSSVPPAYTPKSAKHSYIHPLRTKPYETKRSKGTQVCLEDKGPLQQSEGERLQQSEEEKKNVERKKTVDNGLAVVLQDVISWVSSFQNR